MEKTVSCSKTTNNFFIGKRSIRFLIDNYIKEHQRNALNEKDFFTKIPSIELAIHHAAFALDDRIPPRRYSHQRRIRLIPMREAHKFLSRSIDQLNKFKTFEELHEFLRSAFCKINGLGPLYIYDTALRIGFFRKLEPKLVYLHAGTRVGAKALHLGRGETVSVEALPQELRCLPPHEIENFLCLFKPQ